MAHNFDNIFSGYDTTMQWNSEPNAFLRSRLESLPAGNALDVAMGNGRNALLLAGHNNGMSWNVTGIDISMVGLGLCRDACVDAGVQITRICSTAESYDYGTNKWNVILFFYWPMQHVLQRAFDAMRPGGVLISENFFLSHKDGANDDNCYRSGQLRDIFRVAGLKVEHYEESSQAPEWRYQPSGMGVVQIVGRKPSKP